MDTNQYVWSINRIRSLFVDKTGQTKRVVGSGFWINVDDYAREYAFVTNRHNLDPILTLEGSYELNKVELELRYLPTIEGSLDTFAVRENTSFFEINLENNIYFPESADIALIFPPSIKEPQDYYRPLTSFRLSDLASQEFIDKHVQMTDYCHFIGFAQNTEKTENWWDHKFNSPIARLASIASSPMSYARFSHPKIKTSDVILVSGLSFGGASGNDTTYSYGLASELVEVNYPDGTSEEFSYDNSARLKKIINGRSEESEIDYDALGRINELSFPTTSDPTINYTFRGDSLPDVTTDGVGEVSYEYYSNRWLKAVNYDYSNTGLTNVQRVEYTYHPDGSLDSIIWKDDTTTVATWTYDYDQAGRMTSVSSFGETSNFSYDGQDNLLSQVNHNGTETTYTYNNDRNWPTNIIHDDGSSSFAEYDITYDGGYNTVGNITRVDENVSDYITYGYDDLYRLTSETRTGSGSYTNTFTYDLAGNLTDLNGSAYASYDAGNKISSITSGSITNDNDGNITAVSAPGLSSRTMDWDTRNKMISHTSGGVTVEYGYDGYGKRVWSQVDSDPKTFYIFAGDLLIGEISGGSQLPTAAYTWGADGLVSQRRIQDTETYWYHFGPQGETRFLTDDTATVVNTYVYDAYGITLSSSGSVLNPFRYGGRYGYYTDDDTSLMLAGARWYSPQLKRWISRDPIRYEGGQNLYEYVMQNPVKYVDPDGLDARNYSDKPVWIKPEEGKPFLLPPNRYYEGPVDGAKIGDYWYKVPGRDCDAPDIIIDSRGGVSERGGKGFLNQFLRRRFSFELPLINSKLPGWKKDPDWSDRHPDWKLPNNE